MRELHWHKEAEWGYVTEGGCGTAVDTDRACSSTTQAGDVWLFPAGIPHSIQGLDGGCEFILVFDNGNFSEDQTMLITEWFAHTPREVLAKNFGVPWIISPASRNPRNTFFPGGSGGLDRP